MFDDKGSPIITETEMRQRVFQRVGELPVNKAHADISPKGVESSAKRVVWPFILSVIPWQSSEKQREEIWGDLEWVSSSL